MQFLTHLDLHAGRIALDVVLYGLLPLTAVMTVVMRLLKVIAF